MAHKIELLADHEIAIARAEPNVIPDLVTSLLADIIFSFFPCTCPDLYFSDTLKGQVSRQMYAFETDPADYQGLEFNPS